MTSHSIRIALAALLFSSVLPGQSMAQVVTSGLYLEGRLGSTIMADAEYEELGTTGELFFDEGLVLDLAFGKGFAIGVRAEYEFGLRGADIDKIRIDGSGTFQAAATWLTVTHMLNVYYDFDFERMSADGPSAPGRLVPYLGAGVGLATHVLDFDFGGSEKDTVLAYQGLAGLAFNFTPNWGMTLNYAYLGSSDPQFINFKTEYQSHNITLGLRYTF